MNQEHKPQAGSYRNLPPLPDLPASPVFTRVDKPIVAARAAEPELNPTELTEFTADYEQPTVLVDHADEDEEEEYDESDDDFVSLPSPSKKSRPKFRFLRAVLNHFKKHPVGSLWLLLLLGPLTTFIYNITAVTYIEWFNPVSPQKFEVDDMTFRLFLLVTALSIALLIILRKAFKGRSVVNKTVKGLPEAERLAFNVKQSLLENSTLIEFYAPSKNFTRRWDTTKRKPRVKYKNSPYRSALAILMNAHAYDPPASYTDVERQVLAAAQNIRTIAVIDGDEEYDGNHFKVVLNLAGNDEKKVLTLQGVVRAQLGLYSIRSIEDHDFTTITFVCHKVKPVDKLMDTRIGEEFFIENPCTDIRSIPLALADDGQVWSLPTMHTFILGVTRSGKGSIIQGIIRQLLPFVVEGKCELWGIDPKGTELTVYEDTILFNAVGFNPQVNEETGTSEIEEVINAVYELVLARIANKKPDIEAGDLKRSLMASKETPWHIFIIDEFISVMQMVNNEAKAQLTQIVAMGGSLGVFVIAASQNAEKGDMPKGSRENFSNKIALRIESDYFNDFFLGEGAQARGYDATAISAATPSNGYASAGLGFVKEETGNPLRVRFAYMSDADIIKILKLTTV